MILAPILLLASYLIIAEYMPHLLASNNKGPRLSMNNNKDVQKMTTKQSPSYYSATKVPNLSDPLILSPSIVDVHSCKSKRTTRNKDSPMTTMSAATKKQNDTDTLIPVASTENVCSHESECANIENNNNKRDRTPTRIHAIKRQRFQKNRKIVT